MVTVMKTAYLLDFFSSNSRVMIWHLKSAKQFVLIRKNSNMRGFSTPRNVIVETTRHQYQSLCPNPNAIYLVLETLLRSVELHLEWTSSRKNKFYFCIFVGFLWSPIYNSFICNISHSKVLVARPRLLGIETHTVITVEKMPEAIYGPPLMDSACNIKNLQHYPGESFSITRVFFLNFRKILFHARDSCLTRFHQGSCLSIRVMPVTRKLRKKLDQPH